MSADFFAFNLTETAAGRRFGHGSWESMITFQGDSVKYWVVIHGASIMSIYFFHDCMNDGSFLRHDYFLQRKNKTSLNFF